MMAAGAVQHPAIIASRQSCNTNPTLLIEQRRWLTTTSVGHSHTHKTGLSSEGGNGSNVADPEIERHELLWRQYFLDPTVWWDNRQHKKSSRSPDFRHKLSKEPLWLNSFYKPAWVDAQLTMLDVTAHTVSRLCDQGQLCEAVDALSVLVDAQSHVSTSLLHSVLKTCMAQKNLIVGRRVHDLTVKLGYESNAFLGNHIVRMYACQGRLQEAMDVFIRVAVPDAFVWCSIISAFAKNGKPTQAIHLYHKMRSSGVKPNSYVFVAALQACASATDLESGRQVHADVLESGVPPNLIICSCLVEMYATCGKLEDARTVFDSLSTKNVVTWNSMINGYAERGLSQEALALYAEMGQEGLILADRVTFVCLLKACASACSLQEGKQLHSEIVERGLLDGDLMLGSCLVDMYAKCGQLEDARRVFDDLPKQDAVTWNILINGYAEHGFGQEALALYARMEQEGLVLADPVTFVCLLKACSSAGALQQGKQLHSQILERGLLDLVLGNCLVEMYAKCGKLEDARQVFNASPRLDAVTWNILINGYGKNNEGHKAIDCFREMLKNGVQPDGTTFTCLLVACSHEGLVEEGRQYFNTMVGHHGVMPTIEHYTCMVDLLGRAGHLDEAENMMLSYDSNDVGVMSLLHACRSYGDLQRGRRCFESLVRSNPQNASAYVLMAKMYADAGRWRDVDRVENLRRSAGASKKPALAGIEVNNHVHTFVVGKERDDISCRVQSMNVRLKEEGHVPHTELVLKPVSDKEKEDDLCGHAEKLALAYGLLNTPDGTPLLVTKNLRMCRDCHSSTEIMSRIEKREIVVRDAHRVHRFVGGSCSCGGRP